MRLDVCSIYEIVFDFEQIIKLFDYSILYKYIVKISGSI